MASDDQLTPPLTGPRLLACVSDPANRAGRARIRGGAALAQCRDRRWRRRRRAWPAQQQAAPNLLIVDVDDAEDPVQALYALAELCPPEMSVIAIGSRNDLNLYRDLIELGRHRLSAEADHRADARARAAARQARA